MAGDLHAGVIAPLDLRQRYALGEVFAVARYLPRERRLNGTGAADQCRHRQEHKQGLRGDA